jgi:hypothetical protein
VDPEATERSTTIHGKGRLMALSRKSKYSSLTGSPMMGPKSMGLNMSQATGTGDGLKRQNHGSMGFSPKQPGEKKNFGNYPYVP